MSELKPCPLCNGKANYKYDIDAIYIECSSCHASTAEAKSHQAAAIKWNGIDSLQDKLTTITKQRDELVVFVEILIEDGEIHYESRDMAIQLLSTIKE